MRGYAVGILVFLIAGSAAAQLPAIDPAGQYRLIGLPDRSDSRCIGQPDTPLCAVETLLACFARRDESLCRQVWPRPRPDTSLFPGRDMPGYWWSYRVTAAESAADEAILAIAGRSCGPLTGAPDCVTTPAAPTRYRVHRTAGGSWQVTDWSSPPGMPATAR